jgi:DNA-directed RNA polymerase specialized sigma24 family protein
VENLGPFLPRQVLIRIMSERAVQSLIHYLRQVCDGASHQADTDLLRQFIETNDQRAFEILLARHGPMVLGTARRLVSNTADAEDVFQAVFLSLVRLAKSIRQGQSVPNWLYATTCRIAARARKRQRAIAIENVPEPSAASTVATDLI